MPWDIYDKKIKSFNLDQFKKGKVPHTQDLKFKNLVTKLVDFLRTRSTYNEYYSVVSFLKYHPDVNEILLDYAVVGANFYRNDVSHIILEPLKVDYPSRKTFVGVVLFQNYVPQMYLQHKAPGSDYARNGPIFLDDTESFTVDPAQSTARDDERLWDYFREDPLFHVFHSLLHKVRLLTLVTTVLTMAFLGLRHGTTIPSILL